MPARVVQVFLDALEAGEITVSAFEDAAPGDGEPAWRIELLHRGEPDRQALADLLAPLAERAGVEQIELSTAPVRGTDWLEQSRESFPPQRIGRFWVHGSHVTLPPPEGAVPVLIDAGLAFGSGEHPTTRGCLAALDRLLRGRRVRRVLDLGCGSGILAIAAAKARPMRVLAVDNDPVAVAVARANAADNRVAHRVRCAQADGVSGPAARRGAPYDLILANILADPLRAMARDLARRLAPGGVVVLSGLLHNQAPAVRAAYRAQGLRSTWTIEDGPWSTLVMTRARAAAVRRVR